MKVFDQPFFKKVVVSKGEALVVPRRERNPPILPKAPEGGAIPEGLRGKPQVGFPPTGRKEGIAGGSTAVVVASCPDRAYGYVSS